MVYEKERQLDALRQLEGYVFQGETEIPELHATAVRMEHEKTGARVFLLLCGDPNKVFAIGFRTPSGDSTGVAHIVEHTVLCGSEKYPAKDPFVELAKGSLNTFLNALTYSDKTVYPVASRHEKDFRNLMDVYLDAVFHPMLYREEKIFRQEGWHYEAKSADEPITLNGVVYNEMKGAYSSADGVLERAVNEALFPGHPYAEESGGDPDFIPELSYEAYLDFHRRYYHPSNSFIYLYGSTDMAEQLRYMDETYLSAYERRPPKSEIPEPAPLAGRVVRECEYSIAESESEENATWFSLNFRVGCELDPLRFTAFQLLEYVLLNVPGAPLHDALIPLGEEVSGGYHSGIREPYFSVTVKNSAPERREEFLSLIRGTLRELSQGKLDHDMLRAAINAAEFRAREADFGPYPRGLMYGLSCFDSWLYDADPCMHLRFEELFADLKRKVDENFFEELIREYLLGNPGEALVILKPVRGLTAAKEERLREKLRGVAEGMTREEREALARETEALKAYQREPSAREDLLKIPQLRREDIDARAKKAIFEETEAEGLPLVYSEVQSEGIIYLRLLFDCSSISLEELSFLSLYRDLLGHMDTEARSYAELSTLINLNSGGISFGLESYPDLRSEGEESRVFYAGAKLFPEKLDFALETMREMLLRTVLGNRSRLRENLLEIKNSLKERLTASGHAIAAGRATACVSPRGAFRDAVDGIAYYRLLERLAADFPAQSDAAAARLKAIAEKIFTADNLRVHAGCDRENFEKLRAALKGYRESWPRTAGRAGAFDWKPEIRREAFGSASQVNYVARAGNFRRHGFSYSGALRVLRVLLNYGYLWNNLRTQGGAYGCGASFSRNGDASFASYRDPGLLETDRVYDGIAEYAAHFSADEREMTKNVIGAIAELDAPLTPFQQGMKGLAAFYSHVTEEELQRERDEILRAQPSDINALSPLLSALLSDGAKCVVGNETEIEKAKGEFTDVEPLFRGGEEAI